MRLIDADAAIEAVVGCTNCKNEDELRAYVTKHSLENGWTGGIVDALDAIEQLPSIQPKRNTGQWILDRSGAYCCNKCMEPCASYAMMKPRDKFCKMCGSRNEVMGCD